MRLLPTAPSQSPPSGNPVFCRQLAAIAPLPSPARAILSRSLSLRRLMPILTLLTKVTRPYAITTKARSPPLHHVLRNHR